MIRFANQYQPTADLVAEHWGASTRGILLASPANPTGGMLSATQLAGVCAAVHDNNGVVLLDEIYSGLVFEERPDGYSCGWEIDQD